jgi:ArsR family transcriptional regulator, arsenate/arsenite/antimonite-responsive transcriptional repressor
MQTFQPLGHTVSLAAALADPSRVRALLALRDRELCVCQIVELLGLSTSTVSRHLGQLRRAGLVVIRRDGRWTWYRRVRPAESDEGHTLLGWLDATLGASETAEADRCTVAAIVRRIPGPCAG